MYSSDPTSLDRRSAIQNIALACGLVFSTASLNSLAAALLKPTDMSRQKGGILTANQLTTLREVGEVIIPTTDTPGAIAAKVHDFINQFALACIKQEEQQQLIKGLDTIGNQSKIIYKQPFENLSLTQKIELLTQMEQALSPFGKNDRTHIKLIKNLVTFGYYTSEIGATKELAYLAVPGGYKGNFKFKDIGKAWALSQ